MDIGHGWIHTNMSIKDMNTRMDIDGLNKVSSITIDVSVLAEQMLFCAEDNAELILDWLYHGSRRQQPFSIDCDEPIGLIINKEKWCDRKTGLKCSQLIVVLTKYEEKDGDMSFKITTEYCDLTKEELEQAKRAF